MLRAERGESVDLWKYLSSTDKHIVMYGMGNGADKILAACEKYGIVVEDFFASDGFVRGQSFHSKRVLSFSEIEAKYSLENIIVLVSFASSLPAVIEQICRVAELCETYVPDVPVRGDTLFTEEFEEENREKIERAASLLADSRSLEVYRDVLEFKRTGRLDCLLRTASDRERVMGELLSLESYRCAVDVGAYDGDTARELIELCPDIERIVALEPDRRNFRKLSAYAESEGRVSAVNAAAWSEECVLVFDDSGNRNAGFVEGESRRRAEVRATSLDVLLAGEEVDYIKYDVEGSEREALLGSRRIIAECAPELLVSLYHRTEDIFELILLVNELCPDYKLYLRRYEYVPAWDLNLFAVRK